MANTDFCKGYFYHMKTVSLGSWCQTCITPCSSPILWKEKVRCIECLLILFMWDWFLKEQTFFGGFPWEEKWNWEEEGCKHIPLSREGARLPVSEVLTQLSFPSCVRRNSCRVLIRCSFRKFNISRSEKREEVMFRTAGGWGAEAGGCYVVLVVTLGLIFIIREKQQLQKRLLCCGDGNWAALNIKVLYKMKEEEWFTALRPLALFVRVKHRLVSRVGACALPAGSVAPGVWVRSWASNFCFPHSASAVEQRNIQRTGAHPGRSCAGCTSWWLTGLSKRVQLAHLYVCLSDV